MSKADELRAELRAIEEAEARELENERRKAAQATEALRSDTVRRQHEDAFVNRFVNDFNLAGTNQWGVRQGTWTKGDADRFATVRFQQHVRGQLARVAWVTGKGPMTPALRAELEGENSA